MSLFENTNDLQPKFPTRTKGMFIKGLIHFIDNDKHFEVLQEEFFFAQLEKNGEFLSQDDFDIRAEYELEKDDWGGLDPKEGEVYGFLWHFDLYHTKDWTACGYEYDTDIETLNLEFSLCDEEATERILGEDMFQFEEGAFNE